MRNWLVWLIPVLVLVGCSGTTAQPTATGSPTATPVPTLMSSRDPNPPVDTLPPTSGQTDEGDSYLGGTITWTATASVPVGDTIHTQSVTGTADVLLHVVNPYLILAERETPSTYTYDYTNNYNCAGSHEEGTLESQAGVGTTDFWDYSIATLNPAGRTGQDLHLQVIMPDYCGPSMGGDVDRSVPYFEGFPDCEPAGDQLYARFDGENYVIDCDVIGYSGVDNNIGTVSGHVSGTLTRVDGPR